MRVTFHPFDYDSPPSFQLQTESLGFSSFLSAVRHAESAVYLSNSTISIVVGNKRLKYETENDHFITKELHEVAMTLSSVSHVSVLWLDYNYSSISHLRLKLASSIIGEALRLTEKCHVGISFTTSPVSAEDAQIELWPILAGEERKLTFLSTSQRPEFKDMLDNTLESAWGIVAVSSEGLKEALGRTLERVAMHRRTEQIEIHHWACTLTGADLSRIIKVVRENNQLTHCVLVVGAILSSSLQLDGRDSSSDWQISFDVAENLEPIDSQRRCRVKMSVGIVEDADMFQRKLFRGCVSNYEVKDTRKQAVTITIILG